MVSVVIPTYKRSDTLDRAIHSVLAQTYKDMEILVVDDNEVGSSESKRVKVIVDSIKDSRVRLVTQDKHINGAVARNVGIKESQGVYVAFLDDDDEWLPTKIEQQVEYLNTHKEVDGVTCLYKLYMNGEVIHTCRKYTGEDLQFKVLSRQVAILTSTFLCRKETLLKSGAFNPSLRRHQDLQLFTDFLNYGTIEPIPKYLVKLYAESDINRPNIERFIQIKKEFFDSVCKTLSLYDKKSRKRIMNAHYFEIVHDAIQQGHYGTALKYALKIGISPTAFKDVYQRYKERS